jgi:hypothetical protein
MRFPQVICRINGRTDDPPDVAAEQALPLRFKAAGSSHNSAACVMHLSERIT